MNKRPTYSPADYHQQRMQLHQLVASLPYLVLTAQLHNLNAEPPAPVIFLDGQEGPKFAHCGLKAFDCREIKLINPDRPAIALKFFTKHKYQIDKKPAPDQLHFLLTNQLTQLIDYLTTHADDELARQRYHFLREVQANPDEYSFAISNYYRHYFYPYVSYRYADGEGYSTQNTHLIASNLGEGEPLESTHLSRYNVLFVDVEGITKARPANDHAQAEGFLNGFSHRFDLGKRDLFIHPKSTP